MADIDLPDVRRVETGDGSHIEPPLDQAWSEAEKLAWHAAVTAADTGLDIGLYSRAGDDRDDLFGIRIDRGSLAAYDYHSAWTLLNGIAAGARAAADRATDSTAAELDRVAEDLNARAAARYQIGEDNGSECDGECEQSGCHAVAAAGTYLITRHRLLTRAAELRGGGPRG